MNRGGLKHFALHRTENTKGYEHEKRRPLPSVGQHHDGEEEKRTKDIDVWQTKDEVNEGVRVVPDS